MSPGPSWEHQEMGLTAHVEMRAVCPRELRVLAAPFAVQTAFDSEVQPDSLTVFEHTGSGYEQVAHVVGGEEYPAQRPFPVTIVPARLLDGTRP